MVLYQEGSQSFSKFQAATLERTFRTGAFEEYSFLWDAVSGEFNGGTPRDCCAFIDSCDFGILQPRKGGIRGPWCVSRKVNRLSLPYMDAWDTQKYIVHGFTSCHLR